MPNPIFPNATLQDSQFFRVSLEDSTIRSKADDGREWSRQRHTRPARKTFTSGFTKVTDAVYLAFDAFWETVHGGSLIFDWTNPANLVVYQVRFMGTFEAEYVGNGTNKKWNISFKVRTV